jgi:RNA-directed DNA polymerase
MTDWIRTHRDQKLSRLMKTLKAKLQGTWNYYGLIGNFHRMQLLYEAMRRALYKWLNRRSQRKSLTWPGLQRLLARFQVPRPRIVETQGEMSCQMELSFCQRLVVYPLRAVLQAAHARAS